MTDRTPELSRDELALMAAFEARTGEVSPGGVVGAGADPDVPAELQDELADFVQITRRVGEMELAPVAPSVRSAIMNAAVAQAELNAKPANPLASLLAFLMRPGPVLMGGTAVALLVALIVRPQHEPDAKRTSSAVAMRSPAEAAKESDKAPADEPATEQPVAAAAEAKPAVPPPATAKPAADARVPRRTFAATPASLGPGDKKGNVNLDQAKDAPQQRAGELDDLQAKPTRKRARRASRKVVPPRPAKKKKGSYNAGPTELDLDDGNVDNAMGYAAADSAGYAKPPPPRPAEVQKALEKEAKKKEASPQWKQPPAQPGKPWGLKSADRDRLARNARYAAKKQNVQQALKSARSSSGYVKTDPAKNVAKKPAPPAPSAAPKPSAGSAPRFEPQREKTPAPVKIASKSAGEDESDESVEEAKARKQLQKDISGAVAKLKKKAATSKTEEGRVAVLKQILNLARKNGDVKTERWASNEIKRIRQVQIARAKKAADAKRSASAKKSKAKSAPPAGAASKAKARQRYDVESTSF